MTRTDIDLRPPATVADLMYATGLGRDTVRELIKAGQLPGVMMGGTVKNGKRRGGKFVIPAGEFDKFVAGDWTPTPIQAKNPIEPESFLRKRND